jgi:hypothetical protein
MVVTARSARRSFIDEVSTRHGSRDRIIFRLPESEPRRWIRVNFDLTWPKTGGAKNQMPDDQTDAIAAVLYRTKALLEQTLMQELKVYDIIEGCLKVRYAMIGSSSELTMARAMDRLLAQRELYSVTGVSGHFDGRSVIPG